MTYYPRLSNKKIQAFLLTKYPTQEYQRFLLGMAKKRKELSLGPFKEDQKRSKDLKDEKY